MKLGGRHNREAYSIFALFARLLLPPMTISECQEVLRNGSEKECDSSFEFRAEDEFWNFIKAGLVDNDSITRKYAVHILKCSLPVPEENGEEVEVEGKRTNEKERTNVTVSHTEISSIPVGKVIWEKKEEYNQEAEAQLESLNILEDFIQAPTDQSKARNLQARWEAFILLFETLDEYGLHLAESAWQPQMDILVPSMSSVGTWDLFPAMDVDLSWVAVLWTRGFAHKNPQVRRLVLQSFFACNWSYHHLPEHFVSGPLLRTLDDPVHHRDFGIKGKYTSATALLAEQFFKNYSRDFSGERRLAFICLLASQLLAISSGRYGLMTGAICLEASAGALPQRGPSIPISDSVNSVFDQDQHSNGLAGQTRMESEKTERTVIMDVENQSLAFLDTMRMLLEDTKKHFNPNYRAKVYGHFLRAASITIQRTTVTVRALAHFLEGIPTKLVQPGGALHATLLDWLRPSVNNNGTFTLSQMQTGGYISDQWLLVGLHEMLNRYFESSISETEHLLQEEQEALGTAAKRWVKMLLIGGMEGTNVEVLLKEVNTKVHESLSSPDFFSVKAQKALILTRSLLEMCCTQEEEDQDKGQGQSLRSLVANCLLHMVGQNLDLIVTYARYQNKTFKMDLSKSYGPLPGTVTGRMGGPSQRRLPVLLAAFVISSVLAMQVSAEAFTWILEKDPSFISENLKNCHSFLWEFVSDFFLPSTCLYSTEVEAEIRMGQFEALVPVCKALAFSFTLSFLRGFEWNLPRICDNLNTEKVVDFLVLSIQRGIQTLLDGGALARSRRALLEYFKWSCLEALASVLPVAGFRSDKIYPTNKIITSSLQDETLKILLYDAADSLERVGEDHMLPLLRCLRLLISFGAVQLAGQEKSEREVMRTIVTAGWSAMVDANKRRVAPIAAFLSTVMHPVMFGDPEMHTNSQEVGEEEEGPLKWMVHRLIELGARSPRVMRLASLHMSGLWLQHPEICCLYVPELKTLSLHGADAVDEELDGEIGDTEVAAREYFMLAQSADPELMEIFTNSEMYARVSIAILMFEFSLEWERHRESKNSNERSKADAAKRCGQMLLIDLLRATVNDHDLAKELYKRKSAIHRKKVRAWQMLAILSRFLDSNILGEVDTLLTKAIERNNMPSVRQFLEIFGVQIYLRFPYLVEEHLLPLLHQHNMKTQALSSYVFIAANVVLHIHPPSLQLKMVSLIIPAVLPTMTSHHHNLRSFSQVLLFHVLSQFPSYSLSSSTVESVSSVFDSNCLQVLKKYLEVNEDCAKVREGIDRYLQDFNPFLATTPRGMFGISDDGVLDPSKMVDNLPFECVPLAVYERVSYFLKDAREILREGMAADSAILDLEVAKERDTSRKGSAKGRPNHADEDPDRYEASRISREKVGEGQEKIDSVNKETSLSANWDFQRKIPGVEASKASLPPEDELEDELLLGAAESRVRHLAALRGDRQSLIVVASLIGRIPNLAGLARTCEVFKASALVVADVSVTEERHFQQISVTAEQWIPLIEVSEQNLPAFLKARQQDGYTLLGLEQTANSVPIQSYKFTKHTVLVLGREKEGIPVDILHALDACVEIPQLGIIRSLNVHVSGAIATWEYTKQHLVLTSSPQE